MIVGVPYYAAIRAYERRRREGADRMNIGEA